MRSQFSDQEELWEAISVNISFCRGGNEKKAEKMCSHHMAQWGLDLSCQTTFFSFVPSQLEELVSLSKVQETRDRVVQ